jgi:Raf kinase inhibitor-like YbhB/YbcL family protein
MSVRLLKFGLVAGMSLQAAMAFAADPFAVTSSAFKDGDVWPAKLAWSNAPAGTKSFAIVMFDPDGGNGTGANHWVAYGIPPTKTSLAEGEASSSPKEWMGGKNNVGSDHYFGPCGPLGHSLHHYTITVMATDIEPSAFKPGLTREELLAMLRGHSLAPASIIGRFTRTAP